MNIAIAGYGMEGKVSAQYWIDQGHTITILDERETLDNLPHGISVRLGRGCFDALEEFDMVIRSPGVDPARLKNAHKVWSATNEFFARCPAKIIGVTGTKGKGTTSSMITSVVKASERTVHLVGNIGVPALEVLPAITADSIVVFELSSFQLWDLEFSPSVAVVLLIEADHLNVHHDMDDYVAAKAHITLHQQEQDVVVYNSTNQNATTIAMSSQAARKLAYPIEMNAFTSSIKVPGDHNIENASAAVLVGRELGIDDETIMKGLASFEGLPHRLELIRELDGVSYYNDSFSSAPSATIAAINAFSASEILIIGGVDKGADFSELTYVIAHSQHIKAVILIGEVRHMLAEKIRLASEAVQLVVSNATTMSEVVQEARSLAEYGDVVILSPACASFDMFLNFYDRGDQFRNVVNNL